MKNRQKQDEPLTEPDKWQSNGEVFDSKGVKKKYATAFQLEGKQLRCITCLKISFNSEIPEYVDIICFYMKIRNKPYDYRHIILRQQIDSKIKKGDVVVIDLQIEGDCEENVGAFTADFIERIAFSFGKEDENIELQFQLFKKANGMINQKEFILKNDVKVLHCDY